MPKPTSAGLASGLDAETIRKVGQASLLGAITVLVLYWRRPDQFAHPYLWIEDGAYGLLWYAERGLASIFQPIQGYFILASKLITLTSLKLSFHWAAHIALWLTVGFTVAVVLAIAYSPTHLRSKWLCALAVLLIPTDSEVFAVSAYAFWWAGLLLALALLWDDERGWQPLRWTYLVLGGLSTPLVVPVAALLAVRAVFERTRHEILAAAVACTCGAIQAVSVAFLAKNEAPVTITLSSVMTGFDALVGYLPLGTLTSIHAWSGIGLAVVGAIAAFGIVKREQIDLYFVLLVGLWIGSCALVLARVRPEIIHPFLAGPRYFFYPFIFLTWACVWIASWWGKVGRLVAASAYAVSVGAGAMHDFGSSFGGFSRHQDPLDWRQQVLSCVNSKYYEMPIQYDGYAAHAWKIGLTGDQCRAMVTRSIWSTDPELSPADRINVLEASTVSDEATLRTAASAVGLRNSPNLKGFVDLLKRVDVKTVAIMGWAADIVIPPSGNAAPITIIVYSDGKNVLTVNTKGQRGDVASVLNIPLEAASNVAFQGKLECRPGQKLLIVSATSNRAYALLGTLDCP